MKSPIVGIIGGNGNMGRLFCDFFERKGVKVLISDRGTKLSNRSVAENADIVIVSVPIEKTLYVIKEILPYLKKDSALTDVTSIKSAPLKAMLQANCEIFGMHPMFGNSNEMSGQTIIFCSTKKSGKWEKWLKELFQKNHINIESLPAEKHDKIMNVAQGLVHFAEIIFADGLRRTRMPISEILKYTGKASELKILLAARILAQDPGLYGNIQIANPYALESLKEFKKSFDELYKIVAKKNLKNFEKYFSANKKYLGSYTDDAMSDSAFLIDRLLERRRGDLTEKIFKPDKNSLAVLGPGRSFSDLAADKYLKGTNIKSKKYFTNDIHEVFDLVENGSVVAGIVPVENKLHGSVWETLDGLFWKNVHFDYALDLPINHCLLSLPSAQKDKIKRIISHPQALNQCRKFLRKNFPKATLESSASTSAAVKKLMESHDNTLAVIAPEAAITSGMKALARGIEDETDNSTRFLLLKKGPLPKSIEQKNSSKISIAFYFSADRPGSLFEVFKEFAAAKINLTKIESRPTKAKFGQYIFYLDFEGNLSDEKVKKILHSISAKTAKLKVLGVV